MDLHSILNFTIEAGPIRIVLWEVLYIVVLVQVLAVILNRFLFQPVVGVLDERKRRLDTAATERDVAMRRLEERTRSHAEALAGARREANAAIEAARGEGEGARRAQLDEAKKTAEGRVAIAREALAKSTKKAEHEIRLSALQLGRQIASSILGREVA